MSDGESLVDGIMGTAEVVMRYIDAYNRKDFAGLRSLFDTSTFRFSHQSREAAADDAGEFVAILQRMASDVIPDRRFVEIHALHVVDDVALVDSLWKATPIVTVAGRFAAGVEMTLRLKSFIVVRRGLITEIRDHDS